MRDNFIIHFFLPFLIYEKLALFRQYNRGDNGPRNTTLRPLVYRKT